MIPLRGTRPFVYDHRTVISDREILERYLSGAATYHERLNTTVVAGSTMQRVLALCGRPPLMHVAAAYSLTPAEARVYAGRLRDYAENTE